MAELKGSQPQNTEYLAHQTELLRKVQEYKTPEDPAINSAIKNISKEMTDQAIHVKAGENVFILFDKEVTPLVKNLYDTCLARGATVTLQERDIVREVSAFGDLETDDEKKQFFQEQKDLVDNADAVILCFANTQEAISGLAKVDPDKKIRPGYFKYWNEYAQYGRYHPKNEKFRWTGIRWPTPLEASKEIDPITKESLSFEEYFKIFIEACNQDWAEIEKAHKVLVEKLNKTDKVEILANENDKNPDRRTNLKMSLKGMKAGSSVVDVNYPGSEVFTAPVVDSVNGHLFAGGEFMFQGSIYKDLSIEFKDGKIIEGTCILSDGRKIDLITDVLNPDKNGQGVLYLGEFAFGTNPGLLKRLFNTVLLEKVGGSFHIALGHCYKDEEFSYLGQDLHVNNGNTQEKTPVHWDITVLMHKSEGGGRVILYGEDFPTEGEELTKDGVFHDSRLSALNPPSLIPKKEE